MTTPVENMGFFGVVLTSDGTAYMRPQNTTRPLVSNTGVQLEHGVYRVVASFDGPNEVKIRLYSPKLGAKPWGLREVIGTIPAGGGSRSMRMATIGAADGDYIQMQATGNIEPGAVGTIELFRTPD